MLYTIEIIKHTHYYNQFLAKEGQEQTFIIDKVGHGNEVVVILGVKMADGGRVCAWQLVEAVEVLARPVVDPGGGVVGGGSSRPGSDRHGLRHHQVARALVRPGTRGEMSL